MRMKIKLFVCDDHALFRAGVRAIFRSDPTVEIVGEAGNGNEAIERIKQVHPDIVLMDVSMPGMNGLEATQRIVQSSDEPKVLILSLHDHNELILRCLDAGASGYILKDAPFAQLLYAVQHVFKGGKYLSPGIPDKLLKESLHKSVRPRDTHDELSRRDRKILKLLAEGSSVKEIAFSLKLNVKAVQDGKSDLMRKIHVHDRTELVNYAIRKKIVRFSSAKSSSKPSHRRAA